MLFSVVLASAMLAAQPAPLVLVQTIELPSVEGRIDHLAVNRDDQRLFVAGLGNNSLEVVDLRRNAHLQSIKGLHEPQGIAVVPTPRTSSSRTARAGTFSSAPAPRSRSRRRSPYEKIPTTSDTTPKRGGCTSDTEVALR
jgi:hypothetical protein